AVDPWSAPQTILSRETPNQIATARIDAWPPGPSRAAAPAPKYAFAMPPIDRGRGDQHQRFPPSGPEPAQQQPKQAVSRAKALIRPSEDTELVTQGQHLEQEISTRAVS